jgi:hypothetical protein
VSDPDVLVVLRIVPVFTISGAAPFHCADNPSESKSIVPELSTTAPV